MMILLSVLFFIGKGIPPNKHANFCLLSLFFSKIFIELIYNFLMMFYYIHVSKRHFLNDGLRKNNATYIFRNK